MPAPKKNTANAATPAPENSAAVDQAEPTAAPAAPVEEPKLDSKTRMLKVPYNHEEHGRTVSFRQGKHCWSATGIYLGVDEKTEIGETVEDIGDKQLREEKERLAKLPKPTATPPAAPARQAYTPPPVATAQEQSAT